MSVIGIPSRRFRGLSGQQLESRLVLDSTLVFNEVMYHHRDEPARDAVLEKTVVLPADGQWRYDDQGVDLGAAWRDPASGSFTISGGVNNIRQLGRSGSWQLLLNDTVISQGNNSDLNTSDSPSLFSNGFGTATGITSINYSAGDTITLKILEGDFVNVDLQVDTSATLGKPATIFPVSNEPHVAYYRFEEGDDDVNVVDSLSGQVHGMFVNGIARTTDVPFSVVPQTGAMNLRAADFTQAEHVLIEGSQFVMNGPSAGGPNGDATVEWFMKVPTDDEVVNGHSAILWTSGTGSDADRFNIF
jgi:hypothetical protein